MLPTWGWSTGAVLRLESSGLDLTAPSLGPALLGLRLLTMGTDRRRRPERTSYAARRQE